jgi:hypothetical protein
MTTQKKKPDLDLEDVPEEEGVSKADAEERVEQDPEEQVNYPDQRPDR